MLRKRTELAPRRALPRWLPALALAGIVAAAVLPKPYYVQTAGFARDAEPLIRVGTAAGTGAAGEAAAREGPAWLYTAVKLERASLLQAAYAELTGRGDARAVRAVLGGETEDAYRKRMDEAMRQALLEAARAAAGEAERGWIEEIREETPEPERGAPRSEPDSRPIGRVVGDGSSEPIRLGPAGAGGPSAGLMAALSLYDRLTPEADLLGGRRIAGTGTMDAEGRIGAVGGVGRKAEAASAAGADLFVAPKAEAGEAAEAARRAGGGMMIVGADSLGEAVDLLRQR